MKLRMVGADLFVTDCRTRLPFRFGVMTLTRGALATLRVEIEDDQGGRTIGHSADLLVPKWFDKSPDKSHRDNVQDLVGSFRDAAAAMSDPTLPMLTPFELWWRAYRDGAPNGVVDPSAALVRGFGLALVERAVIDATCRTAGLSFPDALSQDVLGFRPEAVWPELDGWDHRGLGDGLAETITVRHTVGMLDALEVGAVSESDRVSDGLPEALDEDITRHGLDTFKIKLCGERQPDLDRLLALAEVFDRLVPGPLRVTVDANEQFDDVAGVVRLFEDLARHDGGRRILDGLLCVEQPLHRAASFDKERTAALPELTAFAPCIIDESDVDVRAFDRAIALGYRGVSVKNCKGVFRALLNRGLCDVRSSEGARFFQSGEDLTNLPILALQQDLLTQAILGVEHVERNGHHYFRGLSHLPDEEAREALERHPDLYEERDGLVQLRIEGGDVRVGSLSCPGYGYAVDVRTDLRTPLDRWTCPE